MAAVEYLRERYGMGEVIRMLQNIGSGMPIGKPCATVPAWIILALSADLENTSNGKRVRIPLYNRVCRMNLTVIRLHWAGGVNAF